jgi:hypothetical protein
MCVVCISDRREVGSVYNVFVIQTEKKKSQGIQHGHM